MSRAIGTGLLLAAILTAGSAQRAYAQAAPAFGASEAPKQTFNVTFGSLGLTGIDDRNVDEDVIAANATFLDFDTDELTGGKWIVGIEWLLPIGNHLEAGAGVAFTGKRETPSRYRDFVEEGTLEDIEQELSLALTPVSFTVRALPLGQRSPVQPYVGAGLGLFRYEYIEEGDFLDFAFDPPEIFVDTFEASGWEPGLIFLGGLRWAGEAVAVGGEFRYHQVKTDLDTDLFVAPELDLGGWGFQFTIGGRF